MIERRKGVGGSVIRFSKPHLKLLSTVLQLPFLGRLYLRELTDANVDTRGIIHVDQCSKTIVLGLRNTAQPAHSETLADLLDDYMQGCLLDSLSEQSRQFCIQMRLIHWHSICSFPHPLCLPTVSKNIR